MYQVTDENEHQFVIAVDGHAVARIERYGKRVEGDDAAGWAVQRGLPPENHLTDEQWRRLVALIAHAPALLDSIDQCAASLHNCVLHYGDLMNAADRIGRKANADAARDAQAKAEGFDDWNAALAASCEE